MRQETINKRLLASLALLLSVTIAVGLWKKTGPVSSIDRNLFRMENSESIDRVVMEQKGNTIQVYFDGIRWMVNDSLEADRQLIKVLFATMDQVQPKRALTDSLGHAIARQLRERGIRVRFFSKQQLAGDLWVGGNESKSLAYFLREGDAMPYVVDIPGYRVYVSGIFEQDANQWRDKLIFNFNWRNFTHLSATFPKEAGQNFTVIMKEKYFGIDGMAEIDTTKLNDYLDAMSLLEADRFYKPGEDRRFDSLFQVPPSFSIEVGDIAHRTYRMDIFPPLRGINEVVGRIGEEAVIFQKRSIVQIAKKRDFFVKVD